MSLRVRLTLVTLAMVAVALFLAGWATHAALRSFLIDRVDRELATAEVPQIGRFGGDGPAPGGGAGDPGTRFAPTGFRPRSIAQIRDASGAVVSEIRESRDADGALPAAIAPGYSTIDLAGAGSYRVLSVSDGSRDQSPRQHPGSEAAPVPQLTSGSEG